VDDALAPLIKENPEKSSSFMDWKENVPALVLYNRVTFGEIEVIV
jgi:hypothetical protein